MATTGLTADASGVPLSLDNARFNYIKKLSDYYEISNWDFVSSSLNTDIASLIADLKTVPTLIDSLIADVTPRITSADSLETLINNRISVLDGEGSPDAASLQSDADTLYSEISTILESVKTTTDTQIAAIQTAFDNYIGFELLSYNIAQTKLETLPFLEDTTLLNTVKGLTPVAGSNTSKIIDYVTVENVTDSSGTVVGSYVNIDAYLNNKQGSAVTSAIESLQSSVDTILSAITGAYNTSDDNSVVDKLDDLNTLLTTY